jgi:hypothetical protein
VYWNGKTASLTVAPGSRPLPLGVTGALGPDLIQKLISQLLIDQRPLAGLTAVALAGHVCSVGHCVSFREPQFLRPVVRSRHLHAR